MYALVYLEPAQQRYREHHTKLCYALGLRVQGSTGTGSYPVPADPHGADPYGLYSMVCVIASVLALPLGQYLFWVLPERRQASQHAKVTLS
jgi:hypothetical protein